MFTGDLTWVELSAHVKGLPLACRYREAMFLDEELAAEMGEAPDSGKTPPHRLSEWTPEVRALAAVYDRLGGIYQVNYAQAAEKKPPKMPSYPRPVGAATRVAGRRRREKHMEIVARVLPGRG